MPIIALLQQEGANQGQIVAFYTETNIAHLLNNNRTKIKRHKITQIPSTQAYSAVTLIISV